MMIAHIQLVCQPRTVKLFGSILHCESEFILYLKEIKNNLDWLPTIQRHITIILDF
jgi:hypothetical protein